MTAARRALRVDESLDLTEPPERIPALGSLATGLALAGRAGSTPFLVEGARAAAAGPQDGPLGRVVIDGTTVASDLTTEGAPVNLVLAPGMARRELVGPAGTSIEITLVAPTLPLVAVQWASAARPAARTLSLTVLPQASEVRYRLGRGSVSFAQDAPERGVVVGVTPPPCEWTVSEAASGGARLTARLAETQVVTLLVCAGSAEAVRGALGASAHLTAHARRAAEGVTEGLVLSTGSSEVDDSVAWLKARLRAALLRATEREMHDPGRLEDTFWGGLGAVAASDAAGAARALELLESGPDEARAALLAARIALTFGDQAAAARHASTLLEARDGRRGEDAAAMRSLALDNLADALHHAAPESSILELRSAAAGTARRARRLPVVGSGPPTTFASWLGRALRGDATERGRERSGHGPTDAALAAWAAFRGEPDVAWTAWAIRAARGLSGSDGPGLWEPATRALRAPARTAGALLAALAHGFLRLVPDAPVGRARMGPCVVGSLTRFRADGIAVGDARLRLDYERDGTRHRFTLSATAARVPPLLVFDPVVHGRVASARVDSEAADLDSVSEGSSTRVPVQLSVDMSRTLELFVE